MQEADVGSESMKANVTRRLSGRGKNYDAGIISVLNTKNVSVIRHMKLSRAAETVQQVQHTVFGQGLFTDIRYYSVSIVLIHIQFKLWTNVMTELCD